MFRLAPLVLVCSLAACGGDDSGPSHTSGVDSSKKLTALNADEQQEVCHLLVGAQSGVQSKDCGDNVTITALTEMQCVATFGSLLSSCTATVADLEACSDATAEDLCNLASPTCAFLFACVAGDAVK